MKSLKTYFLAIICFVLLSFVSSCHQHQDDYLSSLMAEAKLGNKEAQNDLGCYYFENQDYQEAFSWFQKSAEQGLNIAYYNLGRCYFNGFGVEKDIDQSIANYKTAAEKGMSSAELMLGFIYQDDRFEPYDSNESIQWYKRAASHKQNWAAMQLGNIYQSGVLGEQNDSLAMYWYREAADHGLPQAQFVIGKCYLEGNGVPCNYNLSTQWFRKAADQGLMEAQYALSNNYFYGLGVEKNLEMAQYWQDKANEQRGFAENIALISQIQAPEIASKKVVVIEPLDKKDIKSAADSLYQKGFQALFGNTTQMANEVAIDCLSQAAIKGNKSAKALLSYCFATGLGAHPSKVTAASLFIGKGQIKYSIKKESYTIDFEIFDDGNYEKNMNIDIKD